TRKSSMRLSVPSTILPAASVTVTVTGLGVMGEGPARGPKPAPPPGINQFCCIVRGSRDLAANPFKSPVTEWHLAHVALKYASPALASPTKIVAGRLRAASEPLTRKL